MENIYVKQLYDLDDKTINVIAKWFFDEWMDKEEHCTFEETVSYIKYSSLKDRLPMMFGLFLDEKIIGCYGFGLEDLTPRPDIYPWIQNVYIDKPYRGKGYASIMLKDVKKNAQKHLDCDVLYLYTKFENFYEKFGLEYIGPIDTCAKNPRIQRLYRLKLK